MNSNQFKDMAGNVWTITMTASTVQLLKSKFGFDAEGLSKEGDQNLNLIILGGGEFSAMLEFVLATQIGEREMGETFLFQVNGHVLDDATKPFLRAIADTYPRFKRQALHAVIDKLDGIIEKASQDLAAAARDLKF